MGATAHQWEPDATPIMSDMTFVFEPNLLPVFVPPSEMPGVHLSQLFLHAIAIPQYLHPNRQFSVFMAGLVGISSCFLVASNTGS